MNRLLQLILIVGVAGLSQPGFAMNLDIFDDGAVIYATFTGTILPKQEVTFKNTLTKAIQKKPVAVFIQSDGGAFIAVKPLADMFLDLAKQQYAKYQKPLMIDFQNVCASGCTILSSLLTKNRNSLTLELRAAEATDFGFHGSIVVNHGKTDKKATLGAKTELETQIVQTYLAAGVSPEFLKANAAMFKEHFKATVFTAKQLCDQDTMVIPPDSCVANQLEVYKWIVRWTASEEQKKILLAPAPPLEPAKTTAKAAVDPDVTPEDEQNVDLEDSQTPRIQ